MPVLEFNFSSLLFAKSESHHYHIECVINFKYQCSNENRLNIKVRAYKFSLHT